MNILYVIVGSTIYENKNQKLIYFKGLDEEILKSIFDYGQKIKDTFMQFDTFDGTFIYNEEKFDKEDWKGFKYTIIKSLDEIKNPKIIRIIYSKNDLNYLKNLEKQIKKDKIFEGKVSYYISANRFLEFNAYGIDKGHRLKWLSNYLNIDLSKTIAIGDNYND